MTNDRETLEATLAELAAERQRLTDERAEVTARLRETVTELRELGVPEVRVAGLANVDRKSVRAWTAKDDWHGRPLGGG